MAAISRKPLFFAVLFLVSAFASQSYAAEMTVFGPTQYVRTTGAPDIYDDTFSAIPKEGKLIVKNGQSDGDHRVTYAIDSAKVMVNGEQIFGPSDFNEQVYYLEAPITLLQDNSLRVELRSDPDSFLTIEVTQEAPSPTVTISAAPESIHVGESSILSWSSTNADAASIDQGIGSVPVDGTTSVSPTETTTYTITVTGEGGTAAAGVTVTVVNSAPVSDPQSVSTDEDTAASIILTGSDADEDPLTFQVVSGPGHGSLTGTPPDLTYAPDADYHGPDSFTFKVNDGFVDSEPAAVTITVNPVNDAPVAADDIATTDEDTDVTTGNVLANDTDVDGDTLSVFDFIQPINGTAVANLDGTFTYTPHENFNGADTFTYTVDDGSGGTDTATVTITVNPVNDAPVAEDQAITLDEDGATTIVLTAADVDGDALTYQVVSGPSCGTLTGQAPDLAYTPMENYHGSDSFTFKAGDGTIESNIATISLTINAVNDAPVADPQSVSTDEDTAATIILTGSDADGDPLTFQVVSGPGHGSLTGTPPDLTYAPDADYHGSDSFTFTVNDGAVDSESAMVTITVISVNDAPVADAGPDQSMFVGDTVTLDGSGSSDVDEDPLVYEWSLVSTPQGSTATLSDPSLVNPSFVADASGTYVIQLIVNDGFVDSVPDTVTITISTLNYKPVADAGPDQKVLSGDTVTLDGSGSSDPDDDPLTYVWSFISMPSGSSATLSDAAAINPSFVADLPGTYLLRLIVNDGEIDSDPDTVTIKAITLIVGFDTFPDGSPVPANTVITNQYESIGVMLTTDAGPEAGPYATPESSWFPAVSPPNVLDVDINPYFNSGTFTVTFVDPDETSKPATTSTVGGWFLDVEATGQTILTAYDINRAVLDSIVIPIAGNAAKQFFSISTPGIASATFQLGTRTGDGVGLDDLTFSELVPVVCLKNLAVQSQTGEIALTWTPIGDTDHHDIFRALSLSGPFTKIDEIPATSSSYLDTSVANDVLYYYTIERVPTDGESFCSSDIVAALAPAVPALMAVVPDVTGQLQADAETQITSSYLSVGDIGQVNTDTVPAGYVAGQDPPPHSYVPQYFAIDLDVSTGLAAVSVPDVVGMTQASAEDAILTANLTVGTVTTEHSATVPEGSVISQNPEAGTSVAQGTSVDLVVSLGLAPVLVPDVVGLAQADAESAITGAGLIVGTITTQYSDTVPEGHVISQDPAAGTSVASGSSVDLAVSLGPDTEPPVVTVSVSPGQVNLGDTVLITVLATDNVGIAATTLAVNGEPVSLVDNQATYTATTAGISTAEATATDYAGLTDTDTTTFVVIDPGDTEPPVVSITSPADGDEITAPRDIIGTADDPNLASYTLEFTPKGADEWRSLSVGTTPVINDVLAQFDPTLLTNGIYEIRLYATDFGGNAASITLTYLITGNLKVGLFTISFTDLSVPVSGIPIQVIRTYDSRTKNSEGDFGYGWTLSVRSHPKGQKNRHEGEGWEQTSTGGAFPTYCLEGLEDHFVSFTLADGRTLDFDFTPDPSCQFGVPVEYTNAAYTARPGTSATLEPMGDTALALHYGDLVDTGMNVYDPQEFRLTLKDGTSYLIHLNVGVEEMEDTNGNSLTFSSDGILHSSGKSVTFTRDGQGRITQITDPMGNGIAYAYDQNGDLASVTDQESNETQFTYTTSHGLVDIIDPRGITPARNIYDDDGRLIAHIDAYGNRIEYTHDIEGRQESVTDRLGNITLYIYDDEGNILAKTDALGHTTTYTYDASGNKLTETDPLGNTPTYTYDAMDNLLTQTDPLGHTTTYTYNDRGQVLTTTDPEGYTTTNTYDANGNLLTTTDPLGTTTTNTYDTSGNMLSTTDCMGNTTAYEYDTYGNMTKQTDPLGTVTTYTYDTNGNQLTETTTRTNELGNTVTMTTAYEYDALGQRTRTTDPDGNFTTTEYNSIGKQSATVDKNGNRTEYEYDYTGNLKKTTYPDGTTEINTYDAEGNRWTSEDRAGRVTWYEYDALNRLIGTIFPDGSETAIEYDAAGRVTDTIDENGHSTSFTYDAAGRRTKVIDALGNETSFTCDANGNQLTLTDANGNTTTYDYDALNRRIKTIFPDATFTTIGYDCLGRKISETDQAGVITQFEYDPMGRLIKVIDAIGGETAYTCDEVGNKITQTDPNGHITTWAYDNLGRVVKHTLPLGMSETFTYDPNGNMLTKTDFNGNIITYAYDVNNRLTTKSYPDASQVSFTYTLTGHRETVTAARGVTTYTYDQRDRLLSVTNPDSTTLSYTYDNVGNRTSVQYEPCASSPEPCATIYTYDALNRLSTVIDPDGGVTTYTYDSVGNRKTVTYPNGTVAEYTYDTLNRLTYLKNRKSTGEIISSYTYTLGPSGNRTKVEENTGRVVDYVYDNLYRLTQEAITDPINGNETISYTYDAFGNRLTKSDSSGTVTYAYDANDRLLTEGSNSYTYDNNGNTVSKTDGIDTTTYTYDYENRLIAVQTPSSQLGYAYDPDGIRVSSAVDGVVTDYLIDKNREYAQVLEERDGSATLIVSYVYGDDLISQQRGGADSYYHYDAQSSTRMLTDQAETVTDTYTYDAFGSLTDQAGVTANNYLYTGEQYDPNVGFYYLRARYMNPKIARFVTTESGQGSPFEPVTLHKYLYANCNPVNNLDPSGYTALSVMETMTVFALSAALNSMIMPNLAVLKSYAGRTDRFEVELGYGGSGGKILYFGVITGYIWELNPSRGGLTYPRKRGVFNVTIIGFGAGIGINFPSNPIKFPTTTKRNIEHFDGVGRISSVGASWKAFGASWVKMQLAEGTQIPHKFSVGPSVSAANLGAFVASAYWDLIYVDRI